jgi:hypothetical protein
VPTVYLIPSLLAKGLRTYNSTSTENFSLVVPLLAR